MNVLKGELHVSRAPGRLDVMGGISDYSGSLVLQMPIAEACHVAAQRHPPGSHPQLWQHIRDRHVHNPYFLPVFLTICRFPAFPHCPLAVTCW